MFQRQLPATDNIQSLTVEAVYVEDDSNRQQRRVQSVTYIY